ncbi:MAG TPA: LamG domain-containing protein [Polyangia bacterium]
MCAAGVCVKATSVADAATDFPSAGNDAPRDQTDAPPLDVASLDVAGPDVASLDVAGPDVAAPDVAGQGGSGGQDTAVDQSPDVVEVPPPDWPVCTPPSGVIDLATGLIVYLQLDENSGNPTINDSSTDHLFTMVNALAGGASWVSGRFGFGLSLNGGTDGAWISVEGTDTSAVNKISDGITVAAWAKFPVGAQPNGSVLSRRAAGPKGYLYRFSVADGRLRAQLHTANGSNVDLTANQPLPTDGRWMHLAMTYTDTGPTPGVEMFVNGESFGRVLFALQFGAEETALLMGGDEDVTAVMPADVVINRLGGALDEMAVYNLALSATQVKALACGARPAVLTATAMGIR